ncbi:histidine phosphatase family protein [Luminiphilus sp.]|nr:histidine phosphatase family protein [Luminiphilus sp.]
MTTLWIVRHGEAAASWEKDPDPGLSALGQQQAEATADALSHRVPPDVSLISSPLQRAQETAQALADKLDSRVVEIDSRFSEVRSPVPLSERKVWLQGFMKQTWSEQSDDLWEWRSEILSGLKECTGPTVIFCHFLVINAVIAGILGRSDVLQVYPANASFHELSLDEGELTLVQLGEQMETRVN